MKKWKNENQKQKWKNQKIKPKQSSKKYMIKLLDFDF